MLLGGLTIAIATGTAKIWLVHVVAFVLGCFETGVRHPASSILPNVVGRDRIVA